MHTSDIGLIGLAVMGETWHSTSRVRDLQFRYLTVYIPGKKMWSIVFFVAVVQVNILSLLTRFRS